MVSATPTNGHALSKWFMNIVLLNEIGMYIYMTIVLSFVLFEIAQCGVCKPPAGSPRCVCDTPDGRIDLSSIGNKDGTARYAMLSYVDLFPPFIL